jgi:YidC/Oxa1 family membrane protein insertase
MGLLSAIAALFGKLMFFIYNTIGFQNYVLSLVIFTIVYKLILLPLSIKQIRSTQKMQELQPELQRLQERYKNDREKLNEATMKFYQEKGYNPTSGCLPMLIQLPIILALFYVIRMPMSYMLEIPAKAVGEMAIVAFDKGEINKDILKKKNYEEIKGDALEVYKNLNESDPYFEIKLIETYKKDPEVLQSAITLSDDQRALLTQFNIKMFNFFNLGIVPSLDPSKVTSDPGNYVPALILLILSVASTFLTTMLMMPNTKKDKNSKDKTPNAGCANKGLLYFSPIMTLWIGTVAPSGLSLYWTLNNILSFVQQKALNKVYKKEKEENQVVENDRKRG